MTLPGFTFNSPGTASIGLASIGAVFSRARITAIWQRSCVEGILKSALRNIVKTGCISFERLAVIDNGGN